jgi:hypothetical protein
MEQPMDKSKFLGGNGARLIKQIFIEFDYVSENDNALYTLSRTDKEHEGRVYPSLYRLYMEENDPTEARFVQKYLYDWEQWERMAGSIFSGEIESWRKDLRAKIASELVDRLLADARDTKSRSSTSSAKYLLDHVLKTPGKKAGRPNKNDKPLSTTSLQEVEADLKRIAKHVN